MDLQHLRIIALDSKGYFLDGKEDKYKNIQKVFNNQIANNRHNAWTWIDAIQMAMPGYAMMTMATGNRKYINFAMKSYI